MKVKITKLKKTHPNQVSVLKVGDSIIGELDSWTSIAVGAQLVLKKAYYILRKEEMYLNLVVCNRIEKIIDHNHFDSNYGCYHIEEIS